MADLLGSLVEVGLGYLSLDRESGTLSGGEAQRVKMVRHLGSALTDITYVFDEPTVGLHPHDIEKMVSLLERLRDKGNTVLVVEHKPQVIRRADHIIDIGPGAGTHGGTITYVGALEGLRGSGTVTGEHLDVRPRLRGAPASHRAPRDPRRLHPQPPRRRRGPAARRAHGDHRRGGIGQVEPHPRLHRRRLDGPGGRPQGGRPDRDPRFDPLQPGHLHRRARPAAHRVREGQRRQARPLQRQLGGACPTARASAWSTPTSA
ncbi:hypothetical protein [Tessaracoccus coleopterorum]|uniref:hypothetical protein n=1 Tax=Tessaracoccus coleopterorum TaxID=2714950 RepID=UPI001E59DC38|nr:hypothetical protein [Tessaracoccus coleopterorum]